MLQLVAVAPTLEAVGVKYSIKKHSKHLRNSEKEKEIFAAHIVH